MIYLDHNATTPVDERVLAAAMPYFREVFANPASTTYAPAWQADEAVKKARTQVAKLLSAADDEIVFTSGATESINMALQGMVDLYRGADPSKPLHIITCTTEHSAVIATCEHLAKRGVRITMLDVDSRGLIDIAALEEAMDSDTIMVCIAYANNETGVLQPIQAISEVCKRHKIPLCSDTTQAIGKMSCHPRALGIDIACVSGHKIYGMKGTGVLYLSRKDPRVRINPLLYGGAQEKNRRSGTLNVPGIVALGAAAAICIEEMPKQQAIRVLRDDLEKKLLTIAPALINSTSPDQRLPNVINISYQNLKAEKLIARIHHRLAISLGSACNAGTGKPSRVLQAMGVAPDYLHGAIRISLGRDTTFQDTELAYEILKTEIADLLSPASYTHHND